MCLRWIKAASEENGSNGIMDMATIAAYSGCRVPRYTSYPTAPHFTPAVDAERYGRWLAALDPAASLSLYLHVPFCRTMCWYCGCHTKLAAGDQPVDD